jgi:hypothetical protein
MPPEGEHDPETNPRRCRRLCRSHPDPGHRVGHDMALLGCPEGQKDVIDRMAQLAPGCLGVEAAGRVDPDS